MESILVPGAAASPRGVVFEIRHRSRTAWVRRFVVADPIPDVPPIHWMAGTGTFDDDGDLSGDVIDVFYSEAEAVEAALRAVLILVEA